MLFDAYGQEDNGLNGFWSCKQDSECKYYKYKTYYLKMKSIGCLDPNCHIRHCETCFHSLTENNFTDIKEGPAKDLIVDEKPKFLFFPNLNNKQV